MTDQPEPRNLRASNADRERVASVLNNAMAEGRITVAELEERLDQVYAAKTLGELEPLTSDLPGGQMVAPAPNLPAVPMPAGALDARVGGTPTSRGAIAVMSGTTRKGPWVVPPLFNTVAIMGGVEIDLTEARFSSAVTTITVTAFWGGVEIRVPDDITVQVSGVGIMGAFEDSAHVTGPQGAPLVKINGVAIMGGVEVKRRKKRRKELED